MMEEPRPLVRGDEVPAKARPTADVLAEVLDATRPRSEHEHAAAKMIVRLVGILKECSDDLEIYVEQQYTPLRGYPSYERKRQRDLMPVREARDLIQMLGL